MTTNIPTLNLPTFDVKMRRTTDGMVQVWDTQRRKYVALTPEEWVRQHFVNFLIVANRYPASLIANEVSIRIGKLNRRCDTVVYNRSLQPYMIVEYKAPTVAIDQRVFDQIVRYNMVLHARYLVVTNGLNHFCCAIDYEHNTYSFLPDIPTGADI